MKTFNEWMGTQVDGLSSDYGMTTDYDGELINGQLDQLVTRLEGLVHGLTEAQKTTLIDKFMQQVEERILML